MKDLLAKWYLSHSNIKHWSAAFVFEVYFRLYILCNPGKIKGCRAVAENISRRIPDRSVLSIQLDILFMFFCLGFYAREYQAHHFEEKKLGERIKYYSNFNMIIFNKCFNDQKLANEYYADKSKTYELFKDYFRRDALKITSEDDYMVFCEFSKKHPRFFCKELSGIGGHNACFLQVDDGHDAVEIFHEILLKGKCIIEEPILQHHEMNRLNDSSVNTVRLVTFITREGKIDYLSALVRIGRKGQSVDNASSGGKLCRLNIDSGKIDSPAYSYQGDRENVNPDNGIVYMGFQIPFWLEILRMAHELASKMLRIRYSSWDFALTEDGPVLVEVNHDGGIGIHQIANQYGFRQRIRELVNHERGG